MVANSADRLSNNEASNRSFMDESSAGSTNIAVAEDSRGSACHEGKRSEEPRSAGIEIGSVSSGGVDPSSNDCKASDEGVVGTSAGGGDTKRACNVEDGAGEAALAVPSTGAAPSMWPENQLIVHGVPPIVQGRELAAHLGDAVLEASGHTHTARPAGVGPCLACDIRPCVDGSTSDAVAIFRTPFAAALALGLKGLECLGAPLHLRRPLGSATVPSGDTGSIADILGVAVAREGGPNQADSGEEAWEESVALPPLLVARANADVEAVPPGSHFVGNRSRCKLPEPSPEPMFRVRLHTVATARSCSYLLAPCTASMTAWRQVKRCSMHSWALMLSGSEWHGAIGALFVCALFDDGTQSIK